MKTSKLPCGCHYTVGDREFWTYLCPTHKAEADEIHARWNAEHRAATPLPPARVNLAARNITRIGRAA